MVAVSVLALIISAGAGVAAVAATPPGAAPAAAPAGGAGRPAALIPGLGPFHRAIVVHVPAAQPFFDQGMVLTFAANTEEAVRSFKRAAAIDSQAPMPLWGVAYALGAAFERPRDPAAVAEACAAVQRAMTLAKGAPANDAGWIEALAKRCSADPKADQETLVTAYREAMRALVAAWPDDLDAATLLAASLLDRPAGPLWSADGTPAEGVAEAVGVLESVLRREPDHPGANHLYIHALATAPWPERALASARRLETLVPMAGHLLHAAACIYMRTGDYAAAARADEKAIEADSALFRANGTTPFYSQVMHTEVLETLAAARQMEGRQSDAVKAARAARDNLAPPLAPALIPVAEKARAQPLFVMLRFQAWDDILKEPEPADQGEVAAALRDAARTIACAVRRDWNCADAGHKAFEEARAKVSAETLFGANLAQDILNVAGFIMDGRLLEARGRRDEALASWKSAVQAEDGLTHAVPPDWYYPARESLGGALLRSGRAQEAEKAFRDDLSRHPRNGRSLFGLWKCLEAEKKPEAAAQVKTQFDRAWTEAEVTLRVEDL
jgi:tetratricopeptide (TPR) repeat protein